MKVLDGGPDHLVFRAGSGLHLFLAEGPLLLNLDARACVAGGRLRPAFREAVAALVAELAADDRSTARATVRARTPAGPPRVSALNVNLTDRCNLACVYCYAKGGSYDRISHDMEARLVIDALTGARSVLDRSREFRFEFFGGEPLLNRDAIEGVLDWQAHQDVLPAPVLNRVSTNLTHLTPELEETLRRGRFIVSVSLDGSERTQDTQRPYKDGRGSWRDIIANVRRLKEHAPELTTVARVTAWRSADRIREELEELRDLNCFDYCSVYPAALEDEEGGRVAFSEAFRESFLEFAGRYDRYLSDRGNRFKGCLEVNRYAGHLLLGTAALNHCRAGAGYFSLSPDGSVHPCHRLIGKKEHQIPGGLGGIEATPPAWRLPAPDREPCRTCRVRYGCGGGCKQESLIASGDLLGANPAGCRFSSLLLEASLVAAASLGGPARRRLREACRELTDLFVLCGQDVAPTGQARLARLARRRLPGFLARAR